MSSNAKPRPARRVLLAGATGYIGRCVARELLSRGYEVVAVVREPVGGAAQKRMGRGAESGDAAADDGLPPGCATRLAPVTDRAALEAALAGESFDAVISCIASRSGAPRDAWLVDHQGNSNLLAVAQACGARHFVLLSAICVQRPRLAFQHAKLAFEAELREAGIAYSIVRPTAFFKSLAGQVERVRAGKPFLVFGDGRGTACKPIGEADLATYLVDCLEDPDRVNQVLPIGGPGPALTAREQGELLCELAGQPVKISQVTPRIFDLALAVLTPLSLVFKGLAAKAEFARIGRYYATESMLLWDEAAQRYDADATPGYGTQTLRDFYRRVLNEGMAGQELGEQKLF